ncbi:MAG TPA: hypothetical protein VGX23_27835 [Actinocrinis sp.]|nr:hypothetical protein [Actinocrinis sp.]
MTTQGDSERDLAKMAFASVGSLRATDDQWEPYRLLDLDGEVVRSAAELLDFVFQHGFGDRRKRNNLGFYQSLHTLGVFPDDTPAGRSGRTWNSTIPASTACA